MSSIERENNEILVQTLHRRSSYRPLPAGHIRIIALQPGRAEAPLIADLQIWPLLAHTHTDRTDSDNVAGSSLAAQLGFEAISYCWGNPTRSRTLYTLNGPAILVTESLYAALQAFRHEHVPRHLWADAASINQDDLEERASQVSMMGDIFAQANRVLVWLGLALEGTETLAFTALSAPIVAEGNRSRRKLLALLGDHLGRSRGCACCKAQVASGVPISIDSSLAAVAKLLERPWFERLWVVQEVALAGAIEVYCGKHHADWTIFTELARVPGQYEIESDACEREMLHILPRAALRQVWARMNYLNQLRARNRTRHYLKDSFRPTALCKDLLMLSHLKCREPRDRIFGVSRVLGLNGIPSLQPNYSIPIAELYRRVAALFLSAAANREGGKGTVLLALAGTESPGTEFLDRPSWVPDLQNLSDRSRSKHTLYQWTFAAQRSYGNALSFRCKINPLNPEELLVRGRCIGTVETVLEQSSCPSKHIHRRSHAKCPIDEGVTLVSWHNRCCTFLEQMLLSNESDLSICREIVGETFACGSSMHAAEESPELDLELLSSWLNRRARTNSGREISHLAQDLRPYITGYPFDRERYLCITSTSFGRHAGWLPPSGRYGDTVWYFSGAPYPFLLRPNTDGTFQLLGDTFVQGVQIGDILEFDRQAWSDLLHKASDTDAEVKAWMESPHRLDLKHAADERNMQELLTTDAHIKERRQGVTRQMQRMYSEADGLLGWIRLR